MAAKKLLQFLIYTLQYLVYVLTLGHCFGLFNGPFTRHFDAMLTKVNGESSQTVRIFEPKSEQVKVQLCSAARRNDAGAGECEEAGRKGAQTFGIPMRMNGAYDVLNIDACKPRTSLYEQSRTFIAANADKMDAEESVRSMREIGRLLCAKGIPERIDCLGAEVHSDDRGELPAVPITSESVVLGRAMQGINVQGLTLGEYKYTAGRDVSACGFFHSGMPEHIDVTGRVVDYVDNDFLAMVREGPASGKITDCHVTGASIGAHLCA